MRRKRWLSLFVENDIGVLAEISGMFAGKAYNLDSLTVGVTEDKTVSRMTICLTSDDALFEQIKKQLNRNVNVIKVLDLTDQSFIEKELAYYKISNIGADITDKILRIVKDFGLTIVDTGPDFVLLQSVISQVDNDNIVSRFKSLHVDFMVVRGGSVCICV